MGSLQGAIEAAQQGLIEPMLVGRRERIVKVASDCGLAAGETLYIDSGVNIMA